MTEMTISQYQNDHSRKLAAAPTYVYLLRCAIPGMFKIGVTRHGPRRRAEQCNTGAQYNWEPEQATLVDDRKTAFLCEKTILDHKLVAPFRKEGKARGFASEKVLFVNPGQRAIFIKVYEQIMSKYASKVQRTQQGLFQNEYFE